MTFSSPNFGGGPVADGLSQQIAQQVRVHGYDCEGETCYCVSMNAESESDIEHMSIVEHSAHVASVLIQHLGEVRTISTVEQLEELPIGAVVRGGHPEPWVWERQDTHLSDLYGEWFPAGGEVPHESTALALPALLLWHPDWVSSWVPVPSEEKNRGAPLCQGCGAPLDENHVGSCYGLGGAL